MIQFKPIIPTKEQDVCLINIQYSMMLRYSYVYIFQGLLVDQVTTTSMINTLISIAIIKSSLTELTPGQMSYDGLIWVIYICYHTITVEISIGILFHKGRNLWIGRNFWQYSYSWGGFRGGLVILAAKIETIML